MARVLFALLLAGSLSVQPLSGHSPPDTLKYWVFFTDKDGGAHKTGSGSPGFVTARASARRAGRGSRVPASIDAPVSTEYIRTVVEAGGVPVVRSRWLNAVSFYLTDAEAAAVERLPFVRALQLVGRALPSSVVPESAAAAPPALLPLARLDYGPSRRQLETMNGIWGLEEGINGAGVLLGFLDTEYGDFTHPALDHLLEEGRLIDYRRFAEPQNDRHGLAVASVAVGYAPGQLIGPAWGADVIAATTEYAPSETNQEEDNFVAGLEWLEQNGVDVVNVSLGYTTFDIDQRSYTPGDLDGDTGITTRAVDIAAALGVVVVTSAGNQACASPDACWYYVGTPADADSAIAVGAVTPDSVRASFSSFGPTADGRTKPDVAAQGTNIVLAREEGRYSELGRGTSFSSPLVAGVVCQMLQVNPGLSPIQVRDILRRTASRSLLPDDSLGWGIVDAAAAIQEAQTTVAVELPAPVHAQLLLYPNPASARATLEVHEPRAAGNVVLEVYDVLGRLVVDGGVHVIGAGVTTIEIQTGSLPAGVYLFKLEGEDFRRAGRLVVGR